MKAQIKRLMKATMIYGVGQVLNRFITFLLLPVFTAYLTPGDYGVISILGLLAFVSTSIFTLGFNASMGVCYFERNSQERKEATIWTAFFILLASSLCLAIIGTVFARQISWLAFQSFQYQYVVTISVISTCLSVLSQPFMRYLQFEERARTFVILTTIASLASIGLSVIMVVVLKKGVEGMIESRLIGQAITFVIFFVPVVISIPARFSSILSRSLLRLGIPLVPSFAFVFIIQEGNKYILRWFDKLEAVGVYTIGFSLGMAMSLAVSGFQKAWLPYSMSFIEKREEAETLFGRILTYYVLGFGSLSLLFYIAARPIVMIMTQPEFHQAYKVVGLSASAQFFTGLFIIFLPGVYFAKQVKYVSLIQGAAALITVGLNILLIPLLGFLGAGIALMMGVMAMALLQYGWNILKRKEYLDVKYEWNRIVRFGLIYFCYMVLTIWDRNFSLLGEIWISSMELCLLVVVLYILLNAKEREYLWALKRRLKLGMSGKASPEGRFYQESS